MVQSRPGRVKAAKWSDPESPLPSLGQGVCDWIETFAVHGEGDWLGEPLRLTADAERMLYGAYELGRKGERLVSELVHVAPKDTGKSLTMAAVAAVEGFGPVRFAGWDANGDPVGAPLDSVRVLVVGSAEDQSENTYGPLVNMVGPDTCSDQFFKAYGRVDIGRHEASSTQIILPDHRGVMILCTGGVAAKEGQKATFIGLEETGVWTEPGQVRLYLALRRMTVKRRTSWMMHATNFFEAGAGSALELAYRDVEASFSGARWAMNQPPADLVERLELCEMRDLPGKDLERLLRASYGAAWGHVNRAKIVREIRAPSTPDTDSRRFYGNFAGSMGQGAWFGGQVWTERMSTEMPEDRDLVGLGFVGLDQGGALVACRASDRLLWPVFVWGPGVGRDVVEGEVVAAFGRFRVGVLLANVTGWQTDIDKWASEFGAKVVLQVRWTDGQRLVDMLEAFSTSVHTGQMSHVGAEVLSDHVLGAVTRKSRYGKSSLGVAGLIPAARTGRLIVAAQAAVFAHEAARLAAKVAVVVVGDEVQVW